MPLLAESDASLAARFANQCTANCRASQGTPKECEATCSCVLTGAHGAGLLRHAMAGAMSEAEGHSWQAIVEQCLPNQRRRSPAADQPARRSGQSSRARFDFDSGGHYARPDIFQLIVDETSRSPVSFRNVAPSEAIFRGTARQGSEPFHGPGRVSFKSKSQTFDADPADGRRPALPALDRHCLSQRARRHDLA